MINKIIIKILLEMIKSYTKNLINSNVKNINRLLLKSIKNSIIKNQN